MVERQQLGRQQALEVRPQAHLEDLLAGALEGAPAERERLLAHAADQRGEFPQLRVGGEAAAELDLPPRRGAAGGAEPGAPAPRLLARFVELAREARRRRGQRGAGARGHLAQALGDLLALLAEPRLGHLRRVHGVVAHPPRGGLALLGEAVQVRDLLAATAELVLAPLEVPQVEEVAAREEALLAQHGEHLLREQHDAEPRLRLVELRPLAEMLEEGVAGEGVEQRAAQRRGRSHRLRGAQARLQLEEEAEDVLEERAEVRDEGAAVLGHPGERGGLADERRERAPIVGVALDPAVLVGRDENGARPGRVLTAAGHQSRPSISRSISAISCLSAWARSTGRPPFRACERMTSTLPRMLRILVCASTAARERSSRVSHGRSAYSRSSRDW